MRTAGALGVRRTAIRVAMPRVPSLPTKAPRRSRPSGSSTISARSMPQPTPSTCLYEAAAERVRDVEEKSPFVAEVIKDVCPGSAEENCLTPEQMELLKQAPKRVPHCHTRFFKRVCSFTPISKNSIPDEGMANRSPETKSKNHMKKVNTLSDDPFIVIQPHSASR